MQQNCASAQLILRSVNLILQWSICAKEEPKQSEHHDTNVTMCGKMHVSFRDYFSHSLLVWPIILKRWPMISFQTHDPAGSPWLFQIMQNSVRICLLLWDLERGKAALLSLCKITPEHTATLGQPDLSVWHTVFFSFFWNRKPFNKIQWFLAHLPLGSQASHCAAL